MGDVGISFVTLASHYAKKKNNAAKNNIVNTRRTSVITVRRETGALGKTIFGSSAPRADIPGEIDAVEC